MLYNVEYVLEYISDKACEVCRVGWGNILNVCPEVLFRGSVVSVRIPLIWKAPWTWHPSAKPYMILILVINYILFSASVVGRTNYKNMHSMNTLKFQKHLTFSTEWKILAHFITWIVLFCCDTYIKRWFGF